MFDGAWNDTDTFWWPLTGWDVDRGGLPVVERGWWSIVLELIGIGLCSWLWRRNGLADRARRQVFLTTGRLDAVPERFG